MKNQKEPEVAVGIVSGKQIRFTLNGPYAVQGTEFTGAQSVEISGEKILWNGNMYDELLFEPLVPDASFSLSDVTIGVNFHWERKETQTFLGTLRLIIDGGKVLAINRLPVEKYLESVISSEMSATSSLELLKAHAVISRSWLLAQMDKSRKTKGEKPAFVCNENEILKWYDREDHDLFDVCADDHCQRYQGITKETSPHVAQAVGATRGKILADSMGEICDARFSKCCGGAVEEFQYCWEDAPKSYLKALVDAEHGELPDLTVEANAQEWIRRSPEAFCNTDDKRVLSQVLNDYDQETSDFYRWHVAYTQEQLSTLVAKKLGIDFGEIIDLVPMERGKSGRLCKLKIIGTKRTLAIGKELEIRRALSENHLYSSAFVVDKYDYRDGIPQQFELTGAGWGHGVGLCQIGAAVMGERGYGYDHILLHYYPGAEIKQIYR
ncbi:SpoIID/LytB domain protein [Hoylesella oralis ATCC 33269]|uniref:SpoIID/LytB domain protein n=1 Tax=Hoylesella oralis ATCC 33269 TaxID=873533 RepID=E7RP32_9BACT|nr:SpoIID/LytB domain-containing protein [Hoylesella oralis]EFZ37475.1 SpoIID/LytB domain protein [Hoylesella oralis ATCC 33269]EPH16081.1 SpoIID/LytB domain-containing protein [Hoylesella oralis HGA0225]SHF88877.1 SpoIID/LytB domain protein [Hoylesella oralis]